MGGLKMPWTPKFLCSSCESLLEYVEVETLERHLYHLYLEDDSMEWIDTLEEVDRCYYCPNCGAEVDPYEDYVEVDEEHMLFRVPRDSSWYGDEDVVDIMASYGYESAEELFSEEADFEAEAEDIFINKDEVWEV